MKQTQKHFAIILFSVLLVLFSGCSGSTATPLPSRDNAALPINGKTVVTEINVHEMPFYSGTGTGNGMPDGQTDKTSGLYKRLGLGSEVSFEAFKQAYSGYAKISSRNKDVLTLIDFSKPSTTERLFVIDLAAEEVLFKTHVSHGRNSGENYATSFSNVSGSYQSSLGFYVTGKTYYGKNGYSLLLDGLEKGINDKAKSRAIVVHGAAYANPSAIGKSGRLGRSLGCPALPQAVSKDIINAIKEGSVMFIYADDKDYLPLSTVLSDYDAEA